MGLGQSRQKFLSSEPQTDFIFSVIGEELGFGSCLCYNSFMFFLWRL